MTTTASRNQRIYFPSVPFTSATLWKASSFWKLQKFEETIASGRINSTNLPLFARVFFFAFIWPRWPAILTLEYVHGVRFSITMQNNTALSDLSGSQVSVSSRIVEFPQQNFSREGHFSGARPVVGEATTILVNCFRKSNGRTRDSVLFPGIR